MKITLDMTEKTVEVSDTINLVELIDTMKVLLPKSAWKDYSIKVDPPQTWVIPTYSPTYTPAENVPYVTTTNLHVTNSTNTAD